MDVRATLERCIGAAAVHTSGHDGLQGLPLASPRSESELVELLRCAHRDRLSLVPLGLGSKLGWCRPAEHADFALSTRALAGVVAYEPADGTLTARAGSTLAELADIARAGGNHLTPLVPRPDGSTLGGVLAASQSGLDRARHGPVRNHVLGMRVALADGTLAKSGGRLVKNVTGYDLHRLYCGSHGTLCVIVEATLRLFALPESSVVARADGLALPAALECALALSNSAVRPLAVRIEADTESSDACALSVALAGAAEVVDWEFAQVRSVMPDATRSDGDLARRELARLRDRELESDAWPHLHLEARISEVANRLQALFRAIGSHDLSARAVIDPSIATIDVHLRPAHVDSEVIAALVRELRGAGYPIAVRRSPTAANEALDPFGDPSPALAAMRQLKEALDPQGTFARGRFHGGI